MEIVFIRHGQPEWIRDGLNVTNPPLTELGHAQARAMADTLATQHFDQIYASPLLRARQTAEPLFDIQRRDEQIAPWLEEIRDPAWHGSPQEKAEAAYAELKGRPAHARWDGLEGGESIREFTTRIRAGADAFFADRGMVRTDDELPIWHIEDPDRSIALVAHAGTNSVTIAHLLGLQPTPWEWERFVLGHTSVSRLEALEVHDGFTFSLTKLSDVEHLDVGQRTR
ncbi:histidine phosphatase family protein [Ilumatobacter sp.]|uniref:histidine phosphatase family protein n=1 Tax=Ilumatobacter sp. TaxID=1967498 RepID=UPI003C67CB67